MLPSHTDGHIEQPAAQQGIRRITTIGKCPGIASSALTASRTAAWKRRAMSGREMVTVVMAKFSTLATSVHQLSYLL